MKIFILKFMLDYKKILKSLSIEKVLIFIYFSTYLIILLPFLKNAPISGHDIGAHLVHLRVFTDALHQGQFPVRWIEWTQAGQNQPLFLIYQPFIYYLSQIPHLLGFSLLNSLYIIVIISWLLSGLTMFLFVKNITNNTLAGLVSSSIYVFAPYHILDVLIRNSFPEALALAIIPALFFSIERYFKTQNINYLSLLSLAFGLVLLAHPLTFIVFAIPLFFFIFYLIYKNISYRIKILRNISLSFILGFGISAFFILPSLIEQKYINTQYLNGGIYDFRNHFACINQLIWSDWGYGNSISGCFDKMSFQIGLINLLIFFGSIAFIIYQLKRRLISESAKLVIFFILTTIFGIIMSLSVSRHIWEIIPYISFLQFPWRFLGIVIFSISAISGLLLANLKNKKYRLIIFGMIIILTPLFSYGFIQTTKYLPKNFFAQDSASFYHPSTIFQKKHIANMGYMPKTARVLPLPSKVPENQILIADPDAKISVIKNKFHYKEYVVELKKPSEIILYIHHFPGWSYSINGSNSIPDYSNDYGFVVLQADRGKNHITAEFKDTFIVSLSELITIISIIILAGSLIFSRWRKKILAMIHPFNIFTVNNS